MPRVSENALTTGISGRIGDLVVLQTKYGPVLRTAPRRRAASTPAMVASQDRLKKASLAYGRLTRDEAKLWDRYAEGLAAPDPKSGRLVAPSGQQAHNGLASKRLQMDPAAELPRLPPTGAFPGDGVRVSLASGTPTLPSPEGEGSPLAFLSADVPNQDGVVTEILTQALATVRRRTYPQRYRTAAFVAFSPGGLTIELPLKGPTAFAYRFVEVASRRTTATIEIGVLG